MTSVAQPKTAYLPGSYDPVTNGHLDIIRRAAATFDEVVVGVAADAEKQHLFSLEERIGLLQEACADVGNVRVEGFSGLVVEAAAQAGARVLLKGLRQSSDMAHEFPMAHMNHHLRPGLETMFLLASPGLSYLSSSLVKWVCGMGGDITAHVPPQVAARLIAKLRGA
jgi:pantetheine-phosphate adenylyltransferase